MQRASGYAGPRSGSGYAGALTSGGVVNPLTGLGTGLDKSESSFFTPTRIWWRAPLEILCVQSWAAANFVDIPVEDQFIKWRKFKSDNPDDAETMAKAEKKHKVKSLLALAMKAARQYGNGFLVLMTKEAPMDQPLVPERIRPGDLKAIRQFDRYDCSVYERDYDLFSPTYGKPLLYDFHPSRGGFLRVHASRVIRFDGIVPPSDSGFTIYEQDWSVSKLIPCILSIMQDQVLASAIAHLSQEASIAVLGVASLRETLSGAQTKEASAEDIGRQINQLKSNHRLLMIDKDEEKFERIAVQFSGLADLMDRYAKRVAAAGRIPGTRFWGQAPVGLNATGDSDMKNYIIMMESEREKMLPEVLDLLDEVIARDAGLPEALEYEWISLLELSEQEQAEVLSTMSTALEKIIQAGLIDEDEGRESIDGHPLLPELPGPAPELPEPEPPPVPPTPVPPPPPVPPGSGSGA